MDLSDSSAASARDSLDAFIESYNIGAEPAPIQKAASQLPPLSSPKPVLAAVVQSASSPLRGLYADQDAGGRFEFGSYPQWADGEIRPIVWRVLRREADGLLAVAEMARTVLRTITARLGIAVLSNAAKTAAVRGGSVPAEKPTIINIMRPR